MTCHELLDLLHDDLAGALTRRSRLRVAIHLGFCRACRVYRSSYRATIRLARGCSDPEVGPADVERLIERTSARRSLPRAD